MKYALMGTGFFAGYVAAYLAGTAVVRQLTGTHSRKGWYKTW